MTEQSEMAVFEYRLARSTMFKEVRSRASKADQLAERHEEQIAGDGGLQKAFHELKEDFRDVRRALYALAETKATVRRWVIGVGVPLLAALIGALTMIYVHGLSH